MLACTNGVSCNHLSVIVASDRPAVSVLVGPCCPALLQGIDVDVHTVLLLGK